MDTDALLDQLTQYERLPVAAIEEATARRSEMAPHFCRIIEEFIAGDARGDEDRILLIVHMLGSWQERSAYRLMARLLVSDEEELELALGDAITETVPGIMLNLFDGDPQPLYDIIECETADEFVRSGMLEVVATLAERGDIAKSEVATYLRELYGRLKPQAESHVWVGWVVAIASLGLAEMSDLVNEAFDRGFIEEFAYDRDNFADDLALSTNGAGERFSRIEPFGDTIENLSTWYGFSEEFIARRKAGIEDDDGEGLPLDDELAPLAALDYLDLPPEPVINPYRHVGRNDPCPCGSGKKFKRCCLGKPT
jgi:hypothetical protein